MSDPSHKESSKKRKSTASRSAVEVILDEPSTSAGPVFVNFPSVKPAKTTPFTLYSREVSSTSTSDIAKQRTVLAGETEDVEFFSTNRDYLKGGEAADCQYLPGLYDPSTNTLTLHPSTPLYLMTHRVKRLKMLQTPGMNDPDGRTAWREKRNTLGEAFGTRKAKVQIRAEERNRVDAGAMQGVKGHLMETIAGKAAIPDVIAPPESIPTPNIATSHPLEVYPRESLIPDNEWSAISVTAIIKAPDDRSRQQLLPWSRGTWLQSKMRTIMNEESSERKRKMKYLYYLSSLHCFSSLSNALAKSTPAEVQQKCAGMPVQVLNGLLSRFAELSGKHHVITDKMRTRLLAWICCLCLVLDGGATETGKVAKDLGMPDANVQRIFKSLGCSVNVASVAEREKMGITLQAAQANKRAVLKAPVKFPKIGRRGPAKR